VSVPIGLRWGAAGTPAALRTTFCGDLALAPLRSAAFRREYPVRRRAQRNRALSVNTVGQPDTSAQRSSPVPLQPVDDDVLTGDKAGLRRGKKCHDFGYIPRSANAF
jgi:hypothetical protein